MISDKPSREVQSVRTAFEIVNALQDFGTATPAQLNSQLDLSKSSIHNYLTTLEQMGYVVKDRGRYRLGLRFLSHGVAAQNTLRIDGTVGDTLDTVADDVSLPAWWICEEFGRGIFLDVAVPTDATAGYGSVGKRSYLHTHAPGKAVLASADDRYVERIVDHHGLPARTSKTTTDPDRLFEELREIREEGYAVSRGEAVLGLLSVGVGFHDGADRIHALGVFGQARKFAGSRADEIGTTLLDASRGLEETLRSEADR